MNGRSEEYIRLHCQAWTDSLTDKRSVVYYWSSNYSVQRFKKDAMNTSHTVMYTLNSLQYVRKHLVINHRTKLYPAVHTQTITIWKLAPEETFNVTVLTKIHVDPFSSDWLSYGETYSAQVNVLSCRHRLHSLHPTLPKLYWRPQHMLMY